MRVVKDNLETISVDSLVRELNSSYNLIVYYRASNKKDGTPMFLKLDGRSYFFSSVEFPPSVTFSSNSLGETLRLATTSRKVYVITTEEQKQLFHDSE